jgi:hypothetical protein
MTKEVRLPRAKLVSRLERKARLPSAKPASRRGRLRPGVVACPWRSASAERRAGGGRGRPPRGAVAQRAAGEQARATAAWHALDGAPCWSGEQAGDGNVARRVTARRSKAWGATAAEPEGWGASDDGRSR